jgi:hypothetical protein
MIRPREEIKMRPTSAPRWSVLSQHFPHIKYTHSSTLRRRLHGGNSVLPNRVLRKHPRSSRRGGRWRWGENVILRDLAI